MAYFLEPFSSSVYLLLLLLTVSVSASLKGSMRLKILLPAGITVLFWVAYRLLATDAELAGWLERMNSPVVLAGVFLVLPALYLPRKGWFRLFLILPSILIILAAINVFQKYSQAPEDSGFSWFLVSPAYLISSVVGFLVIARHFVSLENLRRLTRATMLVLLIYGGFAFRQNYTDYREMVERRKTASKDVMLIAETVPVLRSEDQVTHLPGAPCRFSADGGYIQGCPLELLQRTAQVNYSKVANEDISETSLLAVALGALVFITILCFVGARWWCGWICPLSALGDIIDWIRRKIGLPHLKPTQPVKLTYLVSGLSLGGFGLLLAKLYPHIDEQGKFVGCKIPIYPFCKICPGQQVCPVASQGPAAYPAPATWEWLFGFFRIGSLALLGLFLVSFAVGRRLWCHFCPMGMVGGIFNRGGLLKLKKDVRKCNGCGVCNEVCPMDIHSVQEEMEKENVSCFECIYCLKCLDKCPQDGCLSLEFAGHKVAETDFMKTAGKTYN